MTRAERLGQLLDEALSPSQLDVVDESHQHSAGRESHFNVLVVSAAFDGAGRVERHRRVHEALASEFSAGLHALTLTLLTPAEYERRGDKIASPACLGGSKAG